MAARERDTKGLQDKLTLCGREQCTIPTAPRVYELSSLILSIFFLKLFPLASGTASGVLTVHCWDHTELRCFLCATASANRLGGSFWLWTLSFSSGRLTVSTAMNKLQVCSVRSCPLLANFTPSTPAAAALLILFFSAKQSLRLVK